jgi:hypothetical protein
VAADRAMTSALPATRVTALTRRPDQVSQASTLGDHRRDRYQAMSVSGQRTRRAATGDHRTILPATALAVRGTSRHRHPTGSHSLRATRGRARRHRRTARHRTARDSHTSSSLLTGKPRPSGGITAPRRASSRAPAISKAGSSSTPATHRRAGTRSVAAFRRMPGIRSRAATRRLAAIRSNRVTRRQPPTLSTPATPSQARTRSTPATRRQARTPSTPATRRQARTPSTPATRRRG